MINHGSKWSNMESIIRKIQETYGMLMHFDAFWPTFFSKQMRTWVVRPFCNPTSWVAMDQNHRILKMEGFCPVIHRILRACLFSTPKADVERKTNIRCVNGWFIQRVGPFSQLVHSPISFSRCFFSVFSPARSKFRRWIRKHSHTDCGKTKMVATQP